MIARDMSLAELETSGFVKCVARKTCLGDVPQEQRTKILRESLEKQFNDWKNTCPEDEKEALADIRNVAGLLFVALK